MKFAVKITETLTKTILVEAETYAEAQEKVSDAYDDCSIILDADNSNVEVDFSDDTEHYIEHFGQAEFDKMDISSELERVICDEY